MTHTTDETGAETLRALSRDLWREAARQPLLLTDPPKQSGLAKLLGHAATVTRRVADETAHRAAQPSTPAGIPAAATDAMVDAGEYAALDWHSPEGYSGSPDAIRAIINAALAVYQKPSTPAGGAITEAMVEAATKAITRAYCDWTTSKGSMHRCFARAALQAASPSVDHGWPLGTRVRKTRGSSWQGRVVGTYTTAQTSEGYCVESEREPGSVQIYPKSALEIVPDDASPSVEAGEREPVAAVPAVPAWWEWRNPRGCQRPQFESLDIDDDMRAAGWTSRPLVYGDNAPVCSGEAASLGLATTAEIRDADAVQEALAPSVERACRAFYPELFSDDPNEAHRAASPIRVDVKRRETRSRMKAALAAGATAVDADAVRSDCVREASRSFPYSAQSRALFMTGADIAIARLTKQER